MITGKIMGSADQSKIDLVVIQKFQSLISGLAGNINTYLRVHRDVVLKIGHKYVFTQGGAGSKPQPWDLSGMIMKDGFFSFSK